jgi:hypothetical protein
MTWMLPGHRRAIFGEIDGVKPFNEETTKEGDDEMKNHLPTQDTYKKPIQH